MPRIIKMAKGAYTTADITVDSEGRVITASSGSGGAQALNMLLAAEGPSASNVTTGNSSSTIIAYLGGAGGGAGGGRNGNQQSAGGTGGTGGFGFYTAPLAAGTTKAYNVGAGGAGGGVGGGAGQAGSAGGSSTLTDIGTANAGAAGGGGTHQTGTQGADGDSPGGTVLPYSWSIKDDSENPVLYCQGGRGNNAGTGGAGNPGILVVYDQ